MEAADVFEEIYCSFCLFASGCPKVVCVQSVVPSVICVVFVDEPTKTSDGQRGAGGSHCRSVSQSCGSQRN